MNQEIEEALSFIKRHTNAKPVFGIILGTGLSELVQHVNIEAEIEYKEIPHFPLATVESHSGKLIFGRLENQPVVVMQGRFHYYEGYSMQQIAFPVRVLKMLGIQRLLISNVSGGLNPEYKIGDMMVLKDHINLLPEHPLRGKNDEQLGARFPDMLNAYHPEMIETTLAFGQARNFRIHSGVYVSVMGPNLETTAEYVFLRKVGADAVGMSTVPEVISARHMKLPVFAISIITDLGIPGKIQPVSVPEIIKVANEVQPKMTEIISHLIKQFQN